MKITDFIKLVETICPELDGRKILYKGSAWITYPDADNAVIKLDRKFFYIAHEIDYAKNGSIYPMNKQKTSVLEFWSDYKCFKNDKRNIRKELNNLHKKYKVLKLNEKMKGIKNDF